jgi:hypothetical protein
MNKRTVLKGVLGVAVTVAGMVAIPAGPAQAAYVCAKGEVCLYENYNRTGSVFVVPFGKNGMGQLREFRDHKFSNGTNLNDKVSSVDNRSDHLLTLYRNGDFKGPYEWIPANTKRDFSGLRLPTQLRNDEASSLIVSY